MERVTTIPAHPRTPAALSGRRFRALVRRSPEAVAIASWIGLLALVAAWGRALGPGISLPTPPLLARVDPQASLSLLPAVAVAAALVLAGPRLAASLRWRSLLVGAFAATLAWVVALAVVRGPDGLVGPVSWPSEYLAGVHFVATPGDFLAHFTDRIGAYNVHLRGHPPGMVLLLWAMRQIGLGGEWPAAALMIGGGAMTVPAALIALREVADERRARAAAPYLVLLPAALWIGTSADALFAGVTAWAVALAILATRCRGFRSALPALGSGLLFGAGLMLSYGLALVGLICLPVALARRRLDVLAIAAATAGLVLAGFALAGFWWPEGLIATRGQYLAGVAAHRPYGYFLLANLAVLGLLLGPAVIAALARLRDRRVWLLVGGAAAAVALAELSGMSKGEVERIWLPFVPWLALAACTLPARGRSLWLGAQAAAALAIEMALVTKW